MEPTEHLAYISGIFDGFFKAGLVPLTLTLVGTRHFAILHGTGPPVPYFDVTPLAIGS